MWDLTVTFMVDPYVFMVCLTDDPTMCVTPVERCERIIMKFSPQGTSGADRLTTTINQPAITIEGFDGDDVLIARNSGDILEGGKGNDRLFAYTGGSSVVRPGEGADIIIFTNPMNDPADAVSLQGAADEDLLRFYNDENQIDIQFSEIRQIIQA